MFYIVALHVVVNAVGGSEVGRRKRLPQSPQSWLKLELIADRS